MYTANRRVSQLCLMVAMMAAMVLGTHSASAHCGNCGVGGENNIVAVAKKAGTFTTLLTAAEAAGLAPTLSDKGPFTVFAPTDEAFAKLPEGAVAGLLNDPVALKTVLLNHVAAGAMPASKVLSSKSITTLSKQELPIDAGTGAKIGGVTIVKTDIEASNGIIHVVDEVLLPKDIVGLASANEALSTLVSAVKAAELVETLQAKGPFTLFAPTNEAFEKLPEGTLQSLLLPQNKQKLIDILTYHVVPGHVTAEQVVKLTSAVSVQGSKLPIRVEKDDNGETTGVMVKGARVVETDLLAANGVVHVIDSVILPE